MVNEDYWVVVGKSSCPWCDRVKDLLTEKDILYIYMDIEAHPSMRMFLRNSGLTTVPQVFKNGYLIGGFEATEAYLNVNTVD